MSDKCNLLLSILYYLLPLFSMEDSTTTWQNPLYPLMSRYCLPDSYPLLAFNPETSSRVTLASLGTVFQTDHLQVTRPPSNKTIKQPDNKTTKQQNNQTTKQLNNTIRKFPTDRVGERCANVGRESLSVAYHVPPFLFFQRDKIFCVDMSFSM